MARSECLTASCQRVLKQPPCRNIVSLSSVHVGKIVQTVDDIKMVGGEIALSDRECLAALCERCVVLAELAVQEAKGTQTARHVQVIISESCSSLLQDASEALQG